MDHLNMKDLANFSLYFLKNFSLYKTFEELRNKYNLENGNELNDNENKYTVIALEEGNFKSMISTFNTMCKGNLYSLMGYQNGIAGINAKHNEIFDLMQMLYDFDENFNNIKNYGVNNNNDIYNKYDCTNVRKIFELYDHFIKNYDFSGKYSKYASNIQFFLNEYMKNKLYNIKCVNEIGQLKSIASQLQHKDSRSNALFLEIKKNNDMVVRSSELVLEGYSRIVPTIAMGVFVFMFRLFLLLFTLYKVNTYIFLKSFILEQFFIPYL
ncbi:uncharacterized protein PMUG01_01013500 [Plasmodium malariae]|uniref:Uncharacterized protein n=1 Tax=Plasmodium malariae TaxID=5858 RepID=A0A1D3JK26_PLAMA|nr:uncharacterized protein PMUG01_01013500 [Plasmodium malariae]SBT86848.1 hypothetical protein PMUG01_01013500 [Plasmodium malariae]